MVKIRGKKKNLKTHQENKITNHYGCMNSIVTGNDESNAAHHYQTSQTTP